MEKIDMRFIMSRLLDSPIMRTLKLSSAAAYVKDFASINRIEPLMGYRYTGVKIVNNKGELPKFIGQIKDVYLCDNELYQGLFQNNRLGVSLKTSKIPNKDKVAYGMYTQKGNTIHCDIENAVLEVYHSIMDMDEFGFPMLPYDGSLMQAVENYIKFRYFTILWENDMQPRNKVDSAEREYNWYIGQYTSNETIPTYDEAVAWANSWQRLLDDRNQNLDDKSIRQVINI